jgi:hypothetical protein
LQVYLNFKNNLNFSNILKIKNNKNILNKYFYLNLFYIKSLETLNINNVKGNTSKLNKISLFYDFV